MSATTRKPRIALMGEFSAGKSTLSNLLLGARPLPEKVTATRLSPVWMSAGTDDPYRIDIDGTQEPVSLDALEGISVEETRVIRLFFEADILGACDLIDFPGISDPNMSAEVWQRMLDEVDAVLWCTHATQAWRQSEAAVWDTIPEAVREKSILLVTRFDKLTTERDRYRVMARLNKETQGLFGATFPISLTQALAAGDDSEAFEASGGGAFLEHFISMIEELSKTVEHSPKSLFATTTASSVLVAPNEPVSLDDEPEVDADIDVATPEPAMAELRSVPDEPTGIGQPEEVAPQAEPEPEQSDDELRVIPRRIQHASGARSERPSRPQTKEQVMEMMRASRPVPKPTASNESLNSIFHSKGSAAAEDEATSI